MPLPTSDTKWPPDAVADLAPTLRRWSAWYSGDPDDLNAAYRGLAGSPNVRPSQQAGGVVGRVSRWFWGDPPVTAHSAQKLHVPIAADLATGSADLLFSEQVKLSFDKGTDQKIIDRLTQILEANSWESLLLEAAEVDAALGGVFLRATWDSGVSPLPILTPVHADAAAPEFRFGRLSAVTFWQVIESAGSTVLRLLERHEAGRVEHGLYQGTDTQLGTRVPLTDNAATKDLADSVDEQSGASTGFDRITAVYVPNIKPNRLWRNHPIGGSLGRSDYAGVEPLMDSVDLTYTSWMRDVRLARARILAPDHMLETAGRGQGASFDLDREVFAALNMPPGAGGEGGGITLNQFAIRAVEHQATASALLARIIGSAGYSQETFELQESAGGTATATEINARQRKSMTTREKKTRYWSQQLSEILEAVLTIDHTIFNGPGVTRPRVEFPAAVQPSPLELAGTAAALKNAQAASTFTLVKLVNPDWDDKTVQAEVDKILAENSFQVTTPPMPDSVDPNLPAGSSA